MASDRNIHPHATFEDFALDYAAALRIERHEHDARGPTALLDHRPAELVEIEARLASSPHRFSLPALHGYEALDGICVDIVEVEAGAGGEDHGPRISIGELIRRDAGLSVPRSTCETDDMLVVTWTTGRQRQLLDGLAIASAMHVAASGIRI